MMETKSIQEKHEQPDHQPVLMESSSSAETIRSYADQLQYPAKTMTRSSTRTYSLMGEEEKTIAAQDSFYSYFSTPSRISRSSTHQHLFTPEYHNEYPLPTEKNKRDFKKFIPSKRGVCNIMTMLAIISLVVFLFAGYPIITFISRKINQ
ncbi:unnamed protein product [Cunninghamella echinulata]